MRYKLCFGDQINALFNITVPYVWISLDVEIDKKQLEKSVNEALHFHPTFKTKIVKCKGLFYLEENDLPVMIRDFNWNERYKFSLEGNNNYPWVIVCSGNDLIFTGSHAISDGGGINLFLQTVLRIYYELSGEKFVGDFGKLLEDKIEDTIIDPYKKYAVDGAQNPFPINRKVKKKKVNHIPNDMYVTDLADVKIHQFIFDEKDIQLFSKASETSSFAIISVILAKSLARCANFNDGYVKVGVAVNRRAKTKSLSDRNFSYTPFLNYDVALCDNKDIDMIATGFRSQLDIEMDYDNVIYKISEVNKQTEFITKHPIILKLIDLFVKNRLYNNEAKIIYTHIIRPGFDEEILKHIRMFQPIPSKRLAKA